MLTILSQSTSDVHRDRAWRSLRATFPTWEQVLAASEAEIESAIRVAGLAEQKAAAIRGVLRRLEEERGSLSLEHLRIMDDEEAITYLTDFRGVGIKTAACVLGFSLGRPVLPVDTHVHRVARRLGLVPAGTGAVATHRCLNALVPPEVRVTLHLQLIEHGRRVCSARRPDCRACTLESLCLRQGLEPYPESGIEQDRR